MTSWITTPVTEELLRGAVELERTGRGLLPHRLPGWARAQCGDGQLAMVEAQPSGVRLAFRTRATVIELDVIATKLVYEAVGPRPDGVYDLVIDGHRAGSATVPGGDTMTVNMMAGTMTTEPGPAGVASFTGLSARDKDVEIWLPHRERTELVALRTDAPVEAATDHGRPVWLHHGSSISHGSDADTPTQAWPMVAAALGGAELTNLGLGGSALLDPFTARTMRDLPADLISVKMGINIANADLMRRRAFGPAMHGFLDTVRDGHPDAPLLVVSPIYCPIHEDTPGPGAPDFSKGRLTFKATGNPDDVARGKLSLRVIREELAAVVAQRSATDPKIHYLDGCELYGEADYAELPLPDELHPDTATHHRIGERFAKLAFGPGGPFS